MKRTALCLFIMGLMTGIPGCPQVMQDAGATGDGGGDMMGGAEERTLTATLGGGQETLDVATNGFGTATLTLSADESTLTFNIQGSGMTGPVVASHFHNAPAGQDGPIVFDLGPFRTETNGEVTITGTTQLADWGDIDDPLAELLVGNIYINLHTDMFPPGELRGQVLAEE